MLAVNDAVQNMLKQVSDLQKITPTTEHCAIENTVGKVLAAPVKAAFDVPGYDNSAMDGFAVRAEDVTEGCTLTLAATSLAGHPTDHVVQPGECVRIMTGAKVPAGADAVIPQENTGPQENTDQNDTAVTFLNSTQPGANIRRQGEELQSGQTVYESGSQLTPLDIGMLASLGVAEAEVFEPLRVALFSTGDELVLPGQPLQSGQLYDSNRFALRAILTRMGFDVIDLGLIRDEKRAIEQAFKDAAAQADAIVCSGGVSVGDADFTRMVLEESGNIHFWKVAMKPGKPFAFGTIFDTWFFGLPGNPVSATVTLHKLAVPVLKKLAGHKAQQPVLVEAIAGEKLKKRPGRADFQRGVLRIENGVNTVYSSGSQSSAMLSSLVNGNCFINLEQEQGTVEPGDKVLVELFPDYY